VNADWVILEPVDGAGRAVPPGETSATVLLTHLANFVQPLIRYDLGDCVTLLPAPCPCGSPLPALHVQGRRDDTVWLQGDDGRGVALLPLAVTTVIEEGSGVWRFQLQQQPHAGELGEVPPANCLVLRVDGGAAGEDEAGAASDAAHAGVGAARAAAWQRAAASLRGYVAGLGVTRLHLVDDGSAPQAAAGSGKLRRILAQAVV